MGLSIITPHYNELEGLQRIYTLLLGQTQDKWEWIIVDDFSDDDVVVDIKEWHRTINDSRVDLVINFQKSNAAICRNLGADKSRFDHLVFLDADDTISKHFVQNRTIAVNGFSVFKNWAVIDSTGHIVRKSVKEKNCLSQFLSARFVWQTTAILWERTFFNRIGKFDPNLDRLQDVELSIRALFSGEHHEFIDNEIDFYYHAVPIRLKADIVKKSCGSVNYLITKINENYILNPNQKLKLKAYYYACVKGLQRTNNRKDTTYVKKTLRLFYKQKHIDVFVYVAGSLLLFLYEHKLISDSLFLRSNRYFFK